VRVLRVGPPSGRRVRQRIVLEGGLVLRVRPEDVEALGLVAGGELAEETLRQLRARAEAAGAVEMASRLLAVRPRSRREVEDRLRRRRIAPEVIRGVLERLDAEGLLDDARFARAWVASRLALQPSGALRLQGELLRKGVAPEVIESALREAFSDTDEYQLALHVARSRVRRYRAQPAEVVRRRLAGVLHRRGFSPAATAAALRAVLGRTLVTDDG